MLLRNAKLFHALCFKLFIVERANEHEVGKLGDNFLWVGDAAFPHPLPDVVYLALCCSGNHEHSFLMVFESFCESCIAIWSNVLKSNWSLFFSANR